MKLGLFFEICVVSICVVLLAVTGLLFYGWLLRPRGEAYPVWTVIFAYGDGEGLEQRIRWLLWRRGIGPCCDPILLLDVGLTEQGRQLSLQLARRWPVLLEWAADAPEE